MTDLSGKVIILTGAAGGLGQGCARRFLDDGARVVCVDREADRLEALVEELGNPGSDLLPVSADISSEEGNEAAVRQAVDAFGRLDGIHANAGIQAWGPVEDTTVEDWDRVHATNLRGVFLLAKYAIPQLRSAGGGSIVITASLLGIVGDGNLPAYGSSKGALLALCRSLATQHGPDNIRVNTICPGDIETPLLQEFFDFHDDPKAVRKEVIANYPLGRVASPADVAAVAAFLLSDDSSYMTGTDLIVDGGLLAKCY